MIIPVKIDPSGDAEAAGDESRCLRVIFHVPKDYPEVSAPVYEVDDFNRLLQPDHLQVLGLQLEQVLRDMPQEVILFNWIEAVRLFLAEHAEEILGAMTQPSDTPPSHEGRKTRGPDWAHSDKDDEDDEDDADYEDDEDGLEEDHDRIPGHPSRASSSKFQLGNEGREDALATKCPQIVHGEPFEDRKRFVLWFLSQEANPPPPKRTCCRF